MKKTHSGNTPSGVVLYDGPSLINGKPVVCVCTGLDGSSKNPKTGPMAQVFILAAREHPTEALASGGDEAVCGDCKLRNGACYVTVMNGPAQVWRAWKSGKYATAGPKSFGRLFGGLSVRFGAYGDPAAVPLRVWKRVAGACDGHTGYTHAWRYCDPGLKDFVMASVDTEEEFWEARAAGWRTYRMRLDGDPLLEGEFVCPAEREEKKLTCEACLACDGAKASPRAASPSIKLHASPLTFRWKENLYKQATGRLALPLVGAR